MAASDKSIGPEDVIDLTQIDVLVQLGDRSFDERMVPQMIQYLTDIRERSFEYVVPGPKMRVIPVENRWALEIEDPNDMTKALAERRWLTFKPTEWAEAQTISKTRMPKNYHDLCIKEGKRDLAIQNLNSWLQGKDKVMIRTVGDRYRAMVSDRFFAYDNLDLLKEIALNVKAVNDSRGPGVPPVQFWQADVSETNLFIALKDNGQVYDIGKGDNYNVMIVVKNSEVGNGSMSIEPGFFRGMCLNIYTREPALRKIHRGIELEAGMYSPRTREKARDLWHSQVKDVLAATIIDQSYFIKWAESFKQSKEVKITDMAVAVKKVADEFKFNEGEAKAIMDALMIDTTIHAEDRGTAYALLQGMTTASKEFGVDRMYEVSKIAGNVERVLAVVA